MRLNPNAEPCREISVSTDVITSGPLPALRFCADPRSAYKEASAAMRVDDTGEDIRCCAPGGRSLVTTGMPGLTNTSKGMS